MFKYELHSHTSECDKCSGVSGAEYVKLYSEAGYSGMVITDHYFSLFYKWFSDEISKSDHQKTIDRYLKGYFSAKNEAAKSDFTVLCGAEVRLDGFINDYLVYGLEEKDFYNLPLLNRLKSLDELLEVLPDYAVVVQAHPFRDKMTVTDPTPIFGIEVYNGGTDDFRNQMARIYAEHYGKVMTSGSDVHSVEAAARGGIVTERKIITARDLTDVLKCGEYKLITPKSEI